MGSYFCCHTLLPVSLYISYQLCVFSLQLCHIVFSLPSSQLFLLHFGTLVSNMALQLCNSSLELSVCLLLPLYFMLSSPLQSCFLQ